MDSPGCSGALVFDITILHFQYQGCRVCADVVRTDDDDDDDDDDGEKLPGYHLRCFKYNLPRGTRRHPLAVLRLRVDARPRHDGYSLVTAWCTRGRVRTCSRTAMKISSRHSESRPYGALLPSRLRHDEANDHSSHTQKFLAAVRFRSRDSPIAPPVHPVKGPSLFPQCLEEVCYGAARDSHLQLPR